MQSPSAWRVWVVVTSFLLCTCVVSTGADAQSGPQFSAHDNPSNDCGCPRRDDGIPVSSGLLAPYLPKIPNLELGFLYYFGNNVRTGRFTADYLLPFHLSADSVLFGEAHAEGWDFWKTPTVSVNTPAGFTTTTSPSSNRVDLSFGGGYRTMLGANTLLGVNGFYDTSRLFNTWYSSGGVGLEMAANIAGDDAVDANFNWYGNLFNRDALVNAFRNQGNSFDLEAGYSHALFDHAMDLRLKLAGYQFDVVDKVYGWRGGADLITRDGVFTLRYEYGSDRLNGQYNTVGGYVNVGFQLENLLAGESPFTMPEPVFRSPRDLRRLLGSKVKRNWHQPASVILSRANSGPTPSAPCVDSLPGSRVPGPLLVIHGTYNPSPRIDTQQASFTSVTICWCGLQAHYPDQLSFYFIDPKFSSSVGSPVVRTVRTTITGVSNCVNNVPLRGIPHAQDDRSNIFELEAYAGSYVSFSPGGGISFQFH